MVHVFLLQKTKVQVFYIQYKFRFRRARDEARRGVNSNSNKKGYGEPHVHDILFVIDMEFNSDNISFKLVQFINDTK